MRKVVICSIQLRHCAVATPIFLPLSTDTTPRGWFGASFTTSSMDISSTVYTAATSRALGRVLTCMLSNRIDEFWTNCISRWHNWGVMLEVVNLSERSQSCINEATSSEHPRGRTPCIRRTVANHTKFQYLFLM